MGWMLTNTQQWKGNGNAKRQRKCEKATEMRKGNGNAKRQRKCEKAMEMRKGNGKASRKSISLSLIIYLLVKFKMLRINMAAINLIEGVSDETRIIECSGNVWPNRKSRSLRNGWTPLRVIASVAKHHPITQGQPSSVCWWHKIVHHTGQRPIHWNTAELCRRCLFTQNVLSLNP